MKRNRSGLTLVEIVASISLASLAIVLILNAVTQHQRQLKRVALKKQATQHLELMLADWFEEGQPLPENETGEFKTTERYFWQTQTIARSNGPTWKTRTIKITVFETANPTTPVTDLEIIANPAVSNTATGSNRGG